MSPQPFPIGRTQREYRPRNVTIRARASGAGAQVCLGSALADSDLNVTYPAARKDEVVRLFQRWPEIPAGADRRHSERRARSFRTRHRQVAEQSGSQPRPGGRPRRTRRRLGEFRDAVRPMGDLTRTIESVERSEMATDTPMQLGMVGLGRMGAGIVRRLMRDGHSCVGYDVDAHPVQQLAGEGLDGAPSLEEFAAKLEKPRTAWVMVPAGEITEKVIASSPTCSSPGTRSSTVATATIATTSPMRRAEGGGASPR